MASRSSPPISNCSFLHGEEFDFNVFCLGTEVEHGTVAIHRGTGVHDFYTVNIHDATLLVDMGAADQIEVLDVAADALAAHVFAFYADRASHTAVHGR